MARSRNHASYVNVTLPYTQSSYSTQHYQSSPVLPSSHHTPHSQQEHGYYSAEGNWQYFSRGNMQRPTGQVHNPHNQPSGSYSRQPYEESSCETAQFYIQPSQGEPVPPSPSPVLSPTHSETHVSHPEYDQLRPDSTPGYPEFSPPHPESSIEFDLPPPEYYMYMIYSLSAELLFAESSNISGFFTSGKEYSPDPACAGPLSLPCALLRCGTSHSSTSPNGILRLMTEHRQHLFPLSSPTLPSEQNSSLSDESLCSRKLELLPGLVVADDFALVSMLL